MKTKSTSYRGTLTLKTVLIGLLSMGILAGCKKDPAGSDPLPAAQAISFSPATGLAGDEITIKGTFDPDKTRDLVSFGDRPAVINSASATEIRVSVPTDAQDSKISVKVNEKTYTTATEFKLLSIYIAGTEDDGGTAKNVTVAKYWRNGIAVSLSDGTRPSWATSITVSGKDIYVAGYEHNAANHFVAKYWKNGVAVNLSDGTKDAFTSGIAVLGNDVYVTGYDFSTSGRYVAKFWKNGVAKNLSDGTRDALAQAITISGSDIYIAGEEENTSGIKVAKYWKNEIATPLGDGKHTAYITSIAVSGTDVYTAGGEYEATIGSNTQFTLYSRYWKNTSPVTLSDGQKNEAISGIAVSGNDVFVSGYQSVDYSNTIAKQWKNGTPTVLTDGKKPANATGVVESNGHILVIGSEDNVIRYWKDGFQRGVTSGQYAASGMAITVAF